MRPVTVAVFLAVATLVLALGHWYLWRALVRRTRLPRGWRRAGTVALGAAGLLVPAGFLLSRLLPRDDVGWLIGAVYVWLGFAFYAITLLGVWDLVHAPARIAGWVRRRRARRALAAASTRAAAGPPAGAPEPSSEAPAASPPPPTPAASAEALPDGAADLGRRVFLARVAAGGTLLGAAGVTGWGVHEALGELRTPEVPVRLERLPRALAGFRIALLTDLHIGPWLGRDFMERVVARTNALKPDLVAVTGDLVDGSVPMLGADVAPLGGLRAPHGVWFVTGNHEYYSGVEPWVEFLRDRLGVRVLMNEHVAVGDRGPGGATFDLAGVPDHRGGRFSPAHAPDYEAAVRGRDPERELVLLAHQPVQVDGAAAVGAGLQLSGHTHGGQIFPFGFLTGLAQPYIRGLHRHGDRTHIYVSAGTGFWGPPLRVLAPPEITILVLV